MPIELQAPLAVAQHLLEAPAKAAAELASGALEELEKESGGLTAGDTKADAAEKVSVA